MKANLHIVTPWSEDREPGAMWRYSAGDLPDRECWWIVLPNDLRGSGRVYADIEVSWRTTDGASSPPHGLWNVTGTAPFLTVTPSIDIEYWTPDGKRDGSYWHGYITNGVIA